MISIENIKELQQRVQTLGKCIAVEAKRAEVASKTEKTLAADFWDDPKEAEKFLKELSGVKFWVTGYDNVSAAVEDLNVLYDFAKESLEGAEDENTDEVKELSEAYKAALEELEALELRNMLGEEGDNLGAVLTINSGAGGEFAEVSDKAARQLGIKGGVKVTAVREGGFLAKARVRPGFIITHINEKAVTSVADLDKMTEKVTSVDGIYPSTGRSASYSLVE